MSECKLRSTPCEQKLNFDSEGEVIASTTGSLIYIMTRTRLDLSCVVSKATLGYSKTPTEVFKGYYRSRNTPPKMCEKPTA